MVVDAARIALVVYGVVLAAGGVAGFKMAQSLPSLAMGLLGGVLAVAAAIWAGRFAQPGLSAGLVVALVVGGVMLARFADGRKLMPAGITVVFSVLVVLLVSAALASLKSRP